MFPLLAAAATGLAGLGGALINKKSNEKINNQQLAYNREMFEKEKARDIEFFNMQNDYNDPSRQMQRLSEAGLNPNMVYGNGATTTSATPHTSGAQSYSPRATQYDLGSIAHDTMSTYFDAKVKQAQIDNLRAQNTDIVNSAILKSAQTLATLEQGKNTAFKTKFATDTAHITRAYMAEQANKMHYDQYLSQSSASVADEKNQLSLSELKARISMIKSSVQRNQVETAIKELEKNLRENGVNSHDPVYMRVLTQILADKGININTLFK